MQVQNFECQIAKAQIGRYVAGDVLSEEALGQLEAHVGKCAECKQNLAERRAVLQAMLSPTTDPEAKETGSKFDLADFIKSKAQSKKPVQAVVQQPTAKPATFTKPALYSLALGAVLIGMSYVSRNMTTVLGPKAAESATKTTSTPIQAPASHATPPKSTAKPVMKEPSTDAFGNAEAVGAGSSEVEPSDLPTTKSVAPATAKTSKKHSKPKHDSSQAKKPTHHSTNIVRVYEPEN